MSAVGSSVSEALLASRSSATSACAITFVTARWRRIGRAAAIRSDDQIELCAFPSAPAARRADWSGRCYRHGAAFHRRRTTPSRRAPSAPLAICAAPVFAAHVAIMAEREDHRFGLSAGRRQCVGGLKNGDQRLCRSSAAAPHRAVAQHAAEFAPPRRSRHRDGR